MMLHTLERQLPLIVSTQPTTEPRPRTSERWLAGPQRLRTPGAVRIHDHREQRLSIRRRSNSDRKNEPVRSFPIRSSRSDCNAETCCDTDNMGSELALYSGRSRDRTCGRLLVRQVLYR
jgi:hypothetical protein